MNSVLSALHGGAVKHLLFIKSWISSNKSIVSLTSYLGCRKVVLVGELVVQVVLLREMRQECSCSLLSDRITHQLHVSLVFMQHVNYWCDPYKLLPEQPINCWRGWLKKVLSNLANIGLTHHSAAWILCLAKPIKPYFLLKRYWYYLKDEILSKR